MAGDGMRQPGWRKAKSGESLSAYLTAARRQQGLTWDDLVRATDLSLGTIRKIEEGRTLNPGIFTVLKIWRALGLPLEGVPNLEQPASPRRPPSKARRAKGR